MRRAADSIIENSLAPGTRRCYNNAVTKYKDFCRKYHAEDKYYFSAYYVEAYVTYLSQNGLGLSSIQSTLSALRFHCRSNDIHITFDTARLALLLKGIKRTQIPKLRATNAVKLSHLTRLMSAASTIFDYKTGVLVRAMFSMAFFGLLRPSEMALSTVSPNNRLLRSDVLLKQKSIRIRFRSYKHSTKPVVVNIPRQDRLDICPWVQLNNYLCGLAHQGSDPLFGCTIAQANNWLQACISKSGIRTTLGLHSFRRGGATWYSSNGLPDSSLKALGRWSSNAYLVYVKPN